MTRAGSPPGAAPCTECYGSAYPGSALTEKWRGLFLILLAIRKWCEGVGGTSPHVLVRRRDREPVRPLAFPAHDGRELARDEELAGRSCR